MDPKVVAFADVMLIITISSTVLVALGVVAHRFVERTNRMLIRNPGSSNEDSARLQRIENAIDAMSIEIERISEGQRFTTKLLAERSQTPVAD